MNALPTLFISHGSPMHAVAAGRAGEAWTALGQRLPRPRAILVASAHWETELPMVSTAMHALRARTGLGSGWGSF